jgi:hypothetical protein
MPAKPAAPASVCLVETVAGYWLVYSVSTAYGIEQHKLLGTVAPDAESVTDEALKLATGG